MNTWLMNPPTEAIAIERDLTTPDGRTLRILETGQRDGVPVLIHGGTPNSRLLYHVWVEDALARGIRLISYDRPGYGGSTAQRGRSVADATQDAATIAKALGL